MTEYTAPIIEHLSVPDAPVAPLLGKGVSKGREVSKAIQKELLHVEENIGWHQVAEVWRGKRKGWRKGLATVAEGEPRTTDAMVSMFSSSSSV